MRIDEIADALRKINGLEPCPYCGAIKPNTQTPIQHKSNCPLPPAITQYEAREIS